MKNNNKFELRTLALSTLLIIFMLIGSVSCDPCLINGTHLPILKTPSGELDITEIRDDIGGGRNFLKIFFKGDGYTINPDSLKLVADHSNYQINYFVFKTNQPYRYSDEWPDNCDLISDTYRIDNDTVYVHFKAHSIFVKDRNKEFEESPIYHILPCDFILYDGKPVINDTITIHICKCPIFHVNQL